MPEIDKVSLVRNLDAMLTTETDSVRAVTLKQAADTLRKLPTRMSDDMRLEDDTFQVRGYRADTNDEDKEMRLCFFGQHNNSNVLAFMLLRTPEVYEMAQYLLKYYDRLEGIA